MPSKTKKQAKFMAAEKPSAEECAYLAGFIDGEGTLTITMHSRKDRPGYLRFNLRLAVYNTNIQLLERLRAIWGGTITISNRGSKWKPQGQLYWSELGLVPIIDCVMPYLKLKNEQAKIILDVQTTKMEASSGRRNGLSEHTVERRALAYARLKTLNKRGRQDAVKIA